MDVLRGKDAVVEIFKGGAYVPFVCAESFDLSVTTEIISVMTLGDGTWDKKRGQGNSYTLNLAGLWPYDDSVDATILDLLNYQFQMVDITFRIVFNKPDGSLYQQLKGTAVVSTTGISGPVDFVSGTISLIGNGAIELSDTLDVCNKIITSVSYNMVGNDLHIGIIALNVGSVPRYDWRIDGSAINTTLTTAIAIKNVAVGSHLIEIWPICENGISGTLYTHTYIRT